MLRPHLAAELSHDMTVPLTSIIASLEMLEEQLAGHPDPAVGVLLASARHASDRMMRMLGEHMDSDLAAADRDPSEVAHAEVNLSEVALQLAADMAHLLELADATLDIGHLPVVCANPDEMYSVLQNLLTNALKFTRPGERPRVSISARRVSDAWRVSVTDHGVGIPEDRRAQVFSLFNRDRSRADSHGIGLGTVARIVAARGGRVGAEPVDGGGAEIWFELPARPDAA